MGSSVLVVATLGDGGGLEGSSSEEVDEHPVTASARANVAAAVIRVRIVMIHSGYVHSERKTKLRFVTFCACNARS
jgi:hypothetical protein